MNLEQCVKGYMAAAALESREWDFKTAHALVLLKNKLKVHADFFAREELKLAEAYAEKDEKGGILWTGNGSFRFEDPTRADEYARRRQELGETEVEEEFPVFHAPEPDRIRPVHLEALSPFLQFGEEESA